MQTFKRANRNLDWSRKAAEDCTKDVINTWTKVINT